MKVKLETKVLSSLVDIREGFGEELFTALNPPFPRVKLQRFDGSHKGSVISIALDFWLFRQSWVSTVTEDGTDEGKWFFVDEGTELPFFLRKWRHRHVVRQHTDYCIITDDIDYSSGYLLVDIVLYMPMYLQFLYRKPIYRRYFAS